MDALTIVVAALAFGLILLTRPVTALVIYIASMILYPMCLTVPLGTVDFTVPRIVIMAVYAKVFTSGGDPLKGYRWCRVDTFVIVLPILETIAGFAAPSIDILQLVENRAGSAFDLILPYFAIRLIIRTREDILSFFKGAMVVAVLPAVLGAVQAATSTNLYAPLLEHSGFMAGWSDRVEMRHGFYRATGAVGNPISFGQFFSVILAWCMGAWFYLKKQRAVLTVGLAFLGMGMLSSMSSGPMLVIALSVPIVCLYPMRKNWMLFMAIAVAGCVAIEILSNRHWYEVVAGYGTLDPTTAQYRIDLIAEAWAKKGEYWLFGYGPNAGVIGGTGFNWDHKDITNHYILIAVRYGILGLAPFVGATVATLKSLRKAFLRANTKGEQLLVWCMMAALLGTMGSMMSVALLDPVNTMFMMMLGLCASMQFFRSSSAIEPPAARPALRDELPFKLPRENRHPWEAYDR